MHYTSANLILLHNGVQSVLTYYSYIIVTLGVATTQIVVVAYWFSLQGTEDFA